MLILMFSMNTAAIGITPISEEEIYSENFTGKTEKNTAANNCPTEKGHKISADTFPVRETVTLPAPCKSGRAVTTITKLTQRERELTAAENANNTDNIPDKTQKPETYYDTLTAEEISLIEVTIQHEVGGLSKTYKRLIAELIYNRLKSDIYPDTVKEMLYQENQFIGIESWYYPDYPVDDETKAVVKEVFSKDTTTHQALAYYNPALSCREAVIWFEYSGDVQFLFDYSEESWGIVYTTRFFR